MFSFVLVTYFFIYYYRQKFFFFPLLNILETPSAHIYEEVFWENEMGGWVYSPQQNGPRDNILIYFNGNSGNISTRISNIRVIKTLLPSFRIFNMDYPGFGLSSHLDMSFDNIVRECTVMVKAVLRGFDRVDHLMFWGESLGALIQAHVFLQVKDAVNSLIHMNGVASLPEAVSSFIPNLSQGFILPLLPAQQPCLQDIYNQHLDPRRHKLFLFHAEQDDIVSDLQSKRLYIGLKPEIKGSAVFCSLRGKHNMVLNCRENQDIIAKVFQEQESFFHHR